MKKFLLLIAMMFSIASFAQIKSANLTASGLTCSMCSKAIYKSLVKVPSIADVQVDIKNSSYLITFKQGAIVSPTAIKKAVEDAGFSVASLKLTANFNKTIVGQDGSVSLQGANYFFLKTSNQTIQGEKTFTVVDKNYLPTAEQKKYAKDITQQSSADKAIHVIL